MTNHARFCQHIALNATQLTSNLRPDGAKDIFYIFVARSPSLSSPISNQIEMSHFQFHFWMPCANKWMEESAYKAKWHIVASTRSENERPATRRRHLKRKTKSQFKWDNWKPIWRRRCNKNGSDSFNRITEWPSWWRKWQHRIATSINISSSSSKVIRIDDGFNVGRQYGKH